MRRPSARDALLSLLTILAIAGCEVSSEGPRDDDDDDDAAATTTQTMMSSQEADSIALSVRQQVTSVLQSGPQAASAMPALYAADAVLSDETERTYSGSSQIAGAFSQGMPPGATIDIRSSGARGSGDLVVDMGDYTVSMPNPQGGAAIGMNGRYLVVLQRTNDGSWKIVRQITDVVGMGGALPGGPPPADSAPETPAGAR